jgi:hypothetical protein
MNRSFAGAILASFAALAVGACDSAASGGGASYAGSSSSGGGGAFCGAYTTCGSCTPVSGCGWCFNTAGGTCATDPDQCSTLKEFTWTWDPSGCPDLDASVVPLDAGTAGDAGHQD